MKKVLKVIFTVIVSVFAVIGVAVTSVFVYELIHKPEGTVAYDKAEMEQWLLDTTRAHEEESVRYYELKGSSSDKIENDLENFFYELMETDAQYSYEVYDVGYSVEESGNYITVSIWPVYFENDVPYEELITVETPIDAVSYIVEELEQNNGSIIFLYKGDWTESELLEAALMAMANTSDSALYRVDFDNYGLSDEMEDGIRIATVSAELDLDEDELRQLRRRNEELSEAYDELAEEVLATGAQTKGQLYTAAAQLIAQKADYDDDILVSTLTSARSLEEQYSSSAYGAIVEGKTICTGYAMAYRGLCERLGLPCWVMSGNVEGAGHAWNIILLDDGYLYADVTFADGSWDESYLHMTEDELKNRGYYMSVDSIMPY